MNAKEAWGPPHSASLMMPVMLLLLTAAESCSVCGDLRCGELKYFVVIAHAFQNKPKQAPRVQNRHGGTMRGAKAIVSEPHVKTSAKDHTSIIDVIRGAKRERVARSSVLVCSSAALHFCGR